MPCSRRYWSMAELVYSNRPKHRLGRSHMDTNTKAERRAKRINSKLRRKYPLLAPVIATTAEKEAVAIQKIKAGNEARIERAAELDKKLIQRAYQYKADLIDLIGPEKVALLQDYRQQMKERFHALRQPCYEADYWYCQLRKHQSAAQPTNQGDGVQTAAEDQSAFTPRLI